MLAHFGFADMSWLGHDQNTITAWTLCRPSGLKVSSKMVGVATCSRMATTPSVFLSSHLGHPLRTRYRDSKPDAVLCNSKTSVHAKKWGKHDKDIVQFAAQQERLRFANHSSQRKRPPDGPAGCCFFTTNAA